MPSAGSGEVLVSPLVKALIRHSWWTAALFHPRDRAPVVRPVYATGVLLRSRRA